MKFINYGIDLGTTNSLIARFEAGSVQVFKNPVGHKETLPSVVAFRGERILVGDKARELVSKDAGNVFGSFKRKMGTDESFLVPANASWITPIELSAYVLRELKQFVQDGEQVQASVITIPASFDTIQSNATKKAGHEAGLSEVILLQEPIAAALAYFNEQKKELPQSGKWLVYDLGGGTFDVALVTVKSGNLEVTDHEGNNFLGGVDFDTVIIREFIVPRLIQLTGDQEIGEKMMNREGSLEKLFYILQYKSEEAKKELSSHDQADIEFNFPGFEEEIVMTIKREEFNRLIHDQVMETTRLIQVMLSRNGLSARDIDSLIMVGGSTYIPYVREIVANTTHIPLSLDVDPTTAIAVGAAYYAGSRLLNVAAAPASPAATEMQPQAVNAEAVSRSLRSVFPTVSSEEEEVFMAYPEGDFTDMHYRIIREDGGYDSGLKKVGTRITEFLPLIKGVPNRFELRFYDAQNNPVTVQHGPIEIMQGKFNVAGQPLPNDICLEVDDRENNTTKLQVLFQRNDLLPLKKTVYKEITRTITKGSAEVLVVNVLEGSSHARPYSNLVIGVIEIRGKDLTADLIKGSDIELKFEMSESRDLTITAFLAMTEQEFKNVFSTSEKVISIARLRDDFGSLLQSMKDEMRDEVHQEHDSEWAQELKACIVAAEVQYRKLLKMTDKDLTDSKWEIAEARRKIAARYDALGSDQRLFSLQAEYFNLKEYISEHLPYVDLDRERLAEDFERVIRDESSLLKARSSVMFRAKIDALSNLQGRMYANTRHFITSYFLRLQASDINQFPKPQIAQKLFEQGEAALANDRFEELRAVTLNLDKMLYGEEYKSNKVEIKGTGIG